MQLTHELLCFGLLNLIADLFLTLWSIISTLQASLSHLCCCIMSFGLCCAFGFGHNRLCLWLGYRHTATIHSNKVGLENVLLESFVVVDFTHPVIPCWSKRSAADAPVLSKSSLRSNHATLLSPRDSSCYPQNVSHELKRNGLKILNEPGTSWW